MLSNLPFSLRTWQDRCTRPCTNADDWSAISSEPLIESALPMKCVEVQAPALMDLVILLAAVKTDELQARGHSTCIAYRLYEACLDIARVYFRSCQSMDQLFVAYRDVCLHLGILGVLCCSQTHPWLCFDMFPPRIPCAAPWIEICFCPQKSFETETAARHPSGAFVPVSKLTVFLNLPLRSLLLDLDFRIPFGRTDGARRRSTGDLEREVRDSLDELRSLWLCRGCGWSR